MLALLTDDQRRKWTDLQGKPFTFPELGFGGGPGDGVGQGGAWTRAQIGSRSSTKTGTIGRSGRTENGARIPATERWQSSRSGGGGFGPGGTGGFGPRRIWPTGGFGPGGPGGRGGPPGREPREPAKRVALSLHRKSPLTLMPTFTIRTRSGPCFSNSTPPTGKRNWLTSTTRMSKYRPG